MLTRIPYPAVIIAGIAQLILLDPARAQYENTDEEKSAGVKKYGVIHNIAEDRKLEKVGGLYEPESLDKYIKRLVDGLEKKVDGLEAHLTRLDRQMDEIRTSLEEDKKAAASGKNEKTEKK